MKKLLACALIACALTGCAHDNRYPTTLEMIDTGTEKFLISATGFTYQLVDYTDYKAGDFISVIMDDNGTPDSIADDKIVSSRYAGWSYGEE